MSKSNLERFLINVKITRAVRLRNKLKNQPPVDGAARLHLDLTIKNLEDSLKENPVAPSKENIDV